tara:strand:+ start:116 stop:277 length:162 start_codon:yes stop_codon:yes gene_type:complete
MKFSFLIAFGEMELSPTIYWSLISIVIIFLISFILSTIPLAQNILRSKTEIKK